ncbi:hypothetical protein BO85DRAFT_211343 [Aspergillus piperis CBS 112811]|uniref:Uncharacterized protein n=1 Tax=Aspergillus piperis CBS 112811 TaxID=1448313 RepID=A0A8G1QR04_9EURO|nr:hypothetical protein BO85DRAFT_211343 [Aspergillus piperis CBS 112811]RAH52014.1 hypothetical protein BO85DRAFT_211343 [Aspergillus piperis CBS 112811]
MANWKVFSSVYIPSRERRSGPPQGQVKSSVDSKMRLVGSRWRLMSFWAIDRRHYVRHVLESRVLCRNPRVSSYAAAEG